MDEAERVEERPLEDLHDATEVGRMLRRHPRTILNMAKRGELPAVIFGPRTIRFRRADIERYIEAHRTG